MVLKLNFVFKVLIVYVRVLRKPLLAQKVVCSEEEDDGREALIDRTAPPTVKRHKKSRLSHFKILTGLAHPIHKELVDKTADIRVN